MDPDELSKLNVNNSMCAPNIHPDDVQEHPDDVQGHYTCFTKYELVSIINAFNNYILSNKLCVNKLVEDEKNPNKHTICIKIDDIITIKDGDSIKELWYKIYDKLKPICKYESCWVDLEFINKINDSKLRNKLRYFTFKPKFYGNRDKWLNTLDIDYVMQQYEKAYNDFLYIGTEPCDFYKFTKLNYNNICNTKKVGIVFNLDKSDQPGSHWTSLFIDNTNRNIYYFDSTGSNPNKYIRYFIKNYPKEYMKYYKNGELSSLFKTVFTVYINKKNHQKANTECGIYSIYFLLKKIKTDEGINHKRITDKQMVDFRKYLFNKNN